MIALTAWWQTTRGDWLHVEEMIKTPERKRLLPLLDQLALELELTRAEREKSDAKED